MIQGTQKIIKIGADGGITIPAKELKRLNIKFGDEVEFIVCPIASSDSQDRKVLETTKSILEQYKKDFKNLSKR